MEKVETKSVPLSSIRPYAKNPRTRTPESVQKIADSITAYGWIQPIVVDSKGVIIIGHGRYAAARLFKLKTVPVLRLTKLPEARVQFAATLPDA